jgi:hypothetical protein
LGRGKNEMKKVLRGRGVLLGTIFSLWIDTGDALFVEKMEMNG